MSTHKTRAQERIEALETPTATQLLERIAQLEKELAAARGEAGDNLAGWQRATADFQNYRRRTEKESWVEGIAAIDRKLRSLLESEGVTPIEAAGRPFDPREHEALTHEETTKAPDETVIGEIQRGYRIRDRVLRPSLVSVAKNPGSDAGSGGND